MQKLILVLILFCSFGCASVQWVDKETTQEGSRMGIVSYWDEGDIEKAINRAAEFCAPLNPYVIKQQYKSVITLVGTSNRSREDFRYFLSFVCKQEGNAKVYLEQ